MFYVWHVCKLLSEASPLHFWHDVTNMALENWPKSNIPNFLWAVYSYLHGKWNSTGRFGLGYMYESKPCKSKYTLGFIEISHSDGVHLLSSRFRLISNLKFVYWNEIAMPAFFVGNFILMTHAFLNQWSIQDRLCYSQYIANHSYTYVTWNTINGSLGSSCGRYIYYRLRFLITSFYPA